MNCKFQQTGTNYIGTPFGMLHAPSYLEVEDLVGWYTIAYGKDNWEEDPTVPTGWVSHKVEAGDLAMYIKEVPVCLCVNGFFYSPEEVPGFN